MQKISANDSTPAVAIPILDSNVALATPDGWRAQWDMWNVLLRTGTFAKHIRTPDIAIALSKHGSEVYGWGPMESCQKLCLIEGKATLYAEALMGVMLGYVAKTGETLQPVERSATRAAILVRRSFSPEPFTFEYTQEDAIAAGLWDKPNKSGKPSPWMLHHKAMLWARCVSVVSRSAFADVTGGSYAREEFTSDHVTTVRQLTDDEPLEDMLPSTE